MDNKTLSGTSLLLGVLSLIFIFAIIPLLVRMNSSSGLSGFSTLLGFLIAIAGLVLGVWSVVANIKKKEKGTAFAISGIITSTISLIIFGFLMVAIATFN